MDSKLTIRDRLVLAGILDELPASAAKRVMMNDLKDVLALSAKEIKKTEYEETVIPGKGMAFHYKQDKDCNKKITFNDIISLSLKNHFTQKDANEQITPDLLPLYKIFVGKSG